MGETCNISIKSLELSKYNYSNDTNGKSKITIAHEIGLYIYKVALHTCS
jgi:hypothetical protein